MTRLGPANWGTTRAWAWALLGVRLCPLVDEVALAPLLEAA